MAEALQTEPEPDVISSKERLTSEAGIYYYNTSVRIPVRVINGPTYLDRSLMQLVALIMLSCSIAVERIVFSAAYLCRILLTNGAIQ